MRIRTPIDAIPFQATQEQRTDGFTQDREKDPYLPQMKYFHIHAVNQSDV
jgi:hypothetical protein